MVAIVGKAVAAPVTKVIVCSIAGGLASYFTQIAVGKAFDNLFDQNVVEIESVTIETE